MSTPYVDKIKELGGGAEVQIYADSISGSTWTNEAKADHDLTITGATVVSSGGPATNLTKYVDFDGVDDYAETPYHADFDISGSQNISHGIWAWIPTDWGGISTAQPLFSMGADDYEFRESYDADATVQYAPRATIGVKGPVPLSFGEWLFFVITHDGSTSTIYQVKSGDTAAVIVGGPASTTSTLASTNPFALGARASDKTRNFKGRLTGYFAIPGMLLTQQQVWDIYQAASDGSSMELSATVGGTSTATASATIPSPWTDWVSATTDAAPVLDASATAAGSSTASGVASTVHPLSASVSGSSAASGTATAVRKVTGSVTGASAVLGTADIITDDVVFEASGTLLGASTAAASTTTVRALSAAVTGSSAVTAATSAGLVLSVSVSGAATVSASPSALLTVSGASSSGTTATGNATVLRSVSSAVVAAASISGTSSALRSATSQVAGTTSISADGTLLVAADGAIAGAGSVIGSATVILAEIVLSLVRATSTSAELTWTDGGSWDDYLVERDGQIVHVTPLLTFTDTNLEPLTEYAYRVRGRVLQ